MTECLSCGRTIKGNEIVRRMASSPYGTFMRYTMFWILYEFPPWDNFNEGIQIVEVDGYYLFDGLPMEISDWMQDLRSKVERELPMYQ